MTHSVYIIHDRNTNINWRKPLIQSHKIKTTIEMVNGFYSEGAMRYAYRMKDLRDNKLMIAKAPKENYLGGRALDLEDMIKDVESQLICQFIVFNFNDHLVNHINELDMLYNYANCLIYEILDEDSSCKYYWGENFIEGTYEKYNNNAGWENKKSNFIIILKFIIIFIFMKICVL